jgi:hypothetical protein
VRAGGLGQRQLGGHRDAQLPGADWSQSSSRHRAYTSGFPLAMAAIWNPIADALLASSSYASTALAQAGTADVMAC